MKNLILVLVVFCFACKVDESPVYEWHFEAKDSNVVTEANTGMEYAIQSNFDTPEFVKGVERTGLRLDGYSTFIEGELPRKLPLPVVVSAWVALETYPTSDAGFFSLAGEVNKSKNWISAAVNKFGCPMISFSIKGEKGIEKASVHVPKFKWFNVALSITDKKTDLLINGEIVTSKEIQIDEIEFQYFTMGKLNEEEFLHDLFPVSRINGIVDEVKIWDRALSELEFNLKVPEACPDLAIPDSRFEHDFHRPKYHILPAANWTNESHGLIYYNGRYHIFNQKNGTNLYLGQINWGHFSSPDLVQWTEHRPVLTPEEGYDQYGIWSGHAIIDESGKPVIFYTGGDGKQFGMCLAYPNDDALIEWTKFEGNPVVQGPPTEFIRKDFRDPYVWKEDNAWYMMVGFGVVEEEVEKGALLLYKSEDMEHWTFLHELYKSEQDVYDTGVFWEMSVFRKFGDKYVLLVNPIPYQGKPAIALFWVGDFVNERFIPDNKVPRKLEVINRLLSPSISSDKDGNTIAIGIIPDLIHPKLQLKQGWTHLFSIPRVWNLKNGEIHQAPHETLKALRDTELQINVEKVTRDNNLKLISGHHQVEIEAIVSTNTSRMFGLIIGKSTENDEETRIYFDLNTDQLIIDKSKSSKTELMKNNIETGDFALGQNELLKLHLFIDGSVIECFINDKDAFTTRIFPKFESSNEIELFVEEGEISIEKLKVWTLRGSNNKTEFCL